MKNVEKSWLRKISRLIMSLAVTLLFFASTAIEANITLTNEGCNFDPGTTTYTNIATGNDVVYVCDDASYTPGNLGKEWHELDLVPFRLTVDNSGANGSIEFRVGGDFDASTTAGPIGWDYVTNIILDEDATGGDYAACASATLTVSNPVKDDIGSHIYRELSLSGLSDGITCVYSYDLRLALGSSSRPGSSLHNYLADAGGESIGNKTVPLPVVDKEELQAIGKTMTAIQNGSRMWSVEKNASNKMVHFGNTCDVDNSLSQEVKIQVTWIKDVEITPDGNVTVRTSIKATNTALRAIDINVTDILYSDIDLTNEIGRVVCEKKTLPANTNDIEVCNNTFIISADLVGENKTLYDEATATYTDPDIIPPLPIGTIVNQTTATYFAIIEGSENNTDENATITDIESLTGQKLTYSVLSPSLGEFVGYTAPNETTNDIKWTSGIQEDSGTITFTKTLHIDESDRANPVSGTLSDTAQLLGIDKIEVNSGNPLVITIDSDPKVLFTITKEMDTAIIPDGGLDFNFTITGNNMETIIKTIHVSQASSSVSTEPFWINQGDYMVTELPKDGYAVDGNSTRNIEAFGCAHEEVFTNTLADPPGVEVKKVTKPAGSELKWTMQLWKDDLMISEKNVTTADDFVILTDDLQSTAGHYTVREVQIEGWYEYMRSPSSCEFDYDPAADGNRSSYMCIITNAEYASINIIKEVLDGPNASEDDFSFTHNISEIGKFNLSKDGNKMFTELVAGSYFVSEHNKDEKLKLVDHYLSNLTCNTEENINIGGRTVNIELSAGEDVICTFENTERGTVSVLKTEDGQDATQTWQFTLSGDGLGEGIVERSTDESGVLDFSEIRLKPGNIYTLCEIGLPLLWRGTWKLDGVEVLYLQSEHTNEDGTHLDVCADFTAKVGDTSRFEVDNVVLTPSIKVEKLTNGVESAEVSIGDEITWTYTITNTGNIELSIVSVIDNMEGNINCPENLLSAGASMVCEATGTANVISYNNEVEVIATIPEEICYLQQVELSNDIRTEEQVDLCTVSDKDNSEYNIEPVGTVHVRLLIEGEDDGTVFDFDHIIDEVSLQLGHGASRTFNNVPVGSYDVQHLDLQNFDFVSVVCTEFNALVANNTVINHESRLASIVLDHGETVDCTFTLTPKPKEVVQAVAAEEICIGCKSDSSPALGTISMALMILGMLSLSLYFIRREEEV